MVTPYKSSSHVVRPVTLRIVISFFAGFVVVGMVGVVVRYMLWEHLWEVSMVGIKAIVLLLLSILWLWSVLMGCASTGNISHRLRQNTWGSYLLFVIFMLTSISMRYLVCPKYLAGLNDSNRVYFSSPVLRLWRWTFWMCRASTCDT